MKPSAVVDDVVVVGAAMVGAAVGAAVGFAIIHPHLGSHML